MVHMIEMFQQVAGAVAGAVGLDSDGINIPIPGAPQSAGTSAGAIAESKRQIQMTVFDILILIQINGYSLKIA